MMNIRPQHVIIDDFTPSATATGSAEPFRKPDHKSKKHGRPARQRHNETVGGGHFVFRRGSTTGRIKTGSILAGRMPFEHPDHESALAEATRLCALHGGKYEVFSASGSVDAREMGE
jgi:hypothetical protein